MAKRYVVKPFTVGTVTKYKVWDDVLKRFVVHAEFADKEVAARRAAEWDKTANPNQ